LQGTSSPKASKHPDPLELANPPLAPPVEGVPPPVDTGSFVQQVKSKLPQSADQLFTLDPEHSPSATIQVPLYPLFPSHAVPASADTSLTEEKKNTPRKNIMLAKNTREKFCFIRKMTSYFLPSLSHISAKKQYFFNSGRTTRAIPYPLA
jgi:hypothetical protein